MNLRAVLLAGEVERYHHVPGVPNQSLAAHQWGVAIITRYILGTDDECPGCGEEVFFALTHDLGEAYAGDVSFPAKRGYPELKDILDRIEGHYMKEVLDIPAYIEDPLIVKVADYLEGAWYCKRMYKQGYTDALLVQEAFVNALSERIHLLDEPYKGRALAAYEVCK